jgi:hypothetical protein
MTTLRFTVFITVLAAFQATAAPPSDADAAKLLVGTWIIPRAQYPAWSKDGAFVFHSNGTFTSYGIFAIRGGDLRVDIQGKWRVKDGVLIEEVTKSSQPQIIRAGLVTRDILLAVTDKEYRYRTARGSEHTYLRK